MNEAVRIAFDGPLTTAALAARADFTLGLAIVSPSSRVIAGPGGTTDIQPRVMQVLVVLADAAGEVVTRTSLFERCWGGVYVGDDSLNRIIGAIRKLASDIAGGSFEIETIPRTGYRLVGANGGAITELFAQRPSQRNISRRQLVLGGAAAAAVLASGGGLWWSRSRADRQFDQLIDSVAEAVRHEEFDQKTVQMLRRAVSMRPGSAKAWGLLALVRSLLIGDGSENRSRAVDEAEKTARKALSLDPREPNALLAMFELQGSTLDWFTRDRNLRQILAVAPDNLAAILEIGALTAATGLIRESWLWNERALAIEPLSPDFLGKRALKLWVFGRTSEADKVSDQLRGLYPDDPFAWFVRVQIYASTARESAAMALLHSVPPPMQPMADVWRASLPAFDNPSAANVAKAREACIQAVQASGMAANEAILIMSQLRELDTAFEIADGTLLSRGSVLPPEQPGGRRTTEDADWRVNTQWMWAPPVAAMRADPRFLPLCDSIGLGHYWRKRGLKPDYLT